MRRSRVAIAVCGAAAPWRSVPRARGCGLDPSCCGDTTPPGSRAYDVVIPDTIGAAGLRAAGTHTIQIVEDDPDAPCDAAPVLLTISYPL